MLVVDFRPVPRVGLIGREASESGLEGRGRLCLRRDCSVAWRIAFFLSGRLLVQSSLMQY